ncbi:AsmA family protein [Hyphomicrobium sp. CS1GBMeth3]|uniref:AsmA family protein n=1 Tax=Hyphomicrobium sp. CS1GBMeth3 TaxID=1892845 RepID=UPI0009305B10|nr:AsmA family protein [Hyphomicrobium sp. CS1GBMeth3]
MQAPPPGYPPHGLPGEPYPPRRGPGLPPPPMPAHSQRAPAHPYPGGPAKPRRKAGFGTILLYTGLGLGAMVAGAAAFAVMALPAGFVRDRAVAAVKEATGRDLVIAGPTSFSLFPSLAISFSDVTLSGMPGSGAKPLLTTKNLDVSVAFWPLLEREIRVNALTLREPEINLEVDAEGRRSWDFAAARQSSGIRMAQASTGTVSDADPAASSGASTTTLRVSDLKLDNVRVDNGRVTYSDARTGRTSEFSAINMQLATPALTAPLDLEGNAAWKGKTVHFNGALTSLSDVLEERPAKLRLALGADVLDASFEGKATFETLSTEGILSANTSSARALFGWLGTDLPPSRGFGALTAKGLWRSAPDSYTFTTAEIVLDSTTAVGDIKLDTRGARPFIEADLKLTELDLNIYESEGDAPPRAAPTAPASSGEGSPRSIEDLIGNTAPPGPRVKGYTKRDGWDEDAFNLALLGAVDANARLSVDKLTVGSLRLGQSDLNVALKNRVMTTTLDRVSLYEGAGIGTVMLDGTAGTRANLAVDVKLEGVSAQPLFKDMLEIDRLAGKGRVALTLVGQGTNQREIIETLNGRASLAFADGAIIGINVPEMIRNLSKGNLGGLSTAPTDKTDFSEMTSTWTVNGGVAENQDLKLVSPLLRLAGSGRVTLPTRELDYTLRPRIVASLEGQGSAKPDAGGVEIPVHVQGPWDNPNFKPDVAGALNNPKTVEAIKEIGKQFKGKKTDEIVNDLLSGDSKTRKAKGKELLEQFLKQD